MGDGRMEKWGGSVLCACLHVVAVVVVVVVIEIIRIIHIQIVG